MRTARAAIVPAVVLSLALVGCGSSSKKAADPTTTVASSSSSSSPASSGAAIAAKGFAFAPATLTVKAGTTVTVTNGDTTAHTWTADDGSWNVQLPAGGSATHTFDKAGTFAYHCSIHPSMKGTVNVS